MRRFQTIIIAGVLIPILQSCAHTAESKQRVRLSSGAVVPLSRFVEHKNAVSKIESGTTYIYKADSSKIRMRYSAGAYEPSVSEATGFFDIPTVELVVTNSSPNATITISCSGDQFTLNELGSGSKIFFAKKGTTSADIYLTGTQGEKADYTVSISSDSKVNCSGSFDNFSCESDSS